MNVSNNNSIIRLNIVYAFNLVAKQG